MNNKKICFVSHNLYLLLVENNQNFSGGAELQQKIIGSYIHGKGYEVSYVTGIFNDKIDDEKMTGINIYKTFSGNEGLPIIRFFYPRIFKLWKALKRANSDIYYQRFASYTTGIIALYCKLYKKIFIFSGAHDTDFIPEKVMVPYLRDKFLYKYGLKNSSYIIVQSERQKKLLHDNFRLKGYIFNNIYYSKKLTNDKKSILWVSTIQHWKRPDLFLEIAKMFPKLNFIMIGGMGDSKELFNRIEANSKNIPNLNFLGYQTLEKTEKYFDDASIFINTSESEGFPNTFLQAWSRGIMVISMYDLDNIIIKNYLGCVITDLTEIGEHIKNYINYTENNRKKIQTYFNNNFSPQTYLSKLNDLLKE